MSTLSSKGTAWEATRLRVLDRDAWTCQYCGKHLEGADATVDHLTPKAKGGTDDTWNLVASCRKDNGQKQDKVLARMNWYNTEWLDRL